MAKHLLVVLSNAVEGRDAEFNEWYTNRHLGDILNLQPYTAAQRFKLSETQLGDGQLPYKYLAIYEVESDDAADAAKALSSESVGSMYISPALDMGSTVAWLYSPITERVSREALPAASQARG
jgi:hypothetical protein